MFINVEKLIQYGIMRQHPQPEKKVKSPYVALFQKAAADEGTLEELPLPIRLKYRKFSQTVKDNHFTEEETSHLFSRILDGEVTYNFADRKPEAQYQEERKEEIKKIEAQLEDADSIKHKDPIVAMQNFLEYSLYTSYYGTHPHEFHEKFQEMIDYLSEENANALHIMQGEIKATQEELNDLAKDKKEKMRIESYALETELTMFNTVFQIVIDSESSLADVVEGSMNSLSDLYKDLLDEKTDQVPS